MEPRRLTIEHTPGAAKLEAQGGKVQPAEFTAPPALQQKTAQQNQGQWEPGGFVDFFLQNTSDKPKSAAQAEQEARRRKRESVFSAISDGISALSNLYFTTQYAPNSYNPASTMSERTQRRYEQMRQRDEARKRQYMSGYLQALTMDRKEAQARQTQTADRAYKLATLRMKEQLQKIKEKVAAAQMSKEQAQAEVAAITAAYAPYKQEAEIRRTNAQTNNSLASAAAHNRSNSKEWRAMDKNGNERWFSDQDAALDFARQEGTLGSYPIVATQVKNRGFKYDLAGNIVKENGHPVFDTDTTTTTTQREYPKIEPVRAQSGAQNQEAVAELPGQEPKQAQHSGVWESAMAALNNGFIPRAFDSVPEEEITPPGRRKKSINSNENTPPGRR